MATFNLPPEPSSPNAEIISLLISLSSPHHNKERHSLALRTVDSVSSSPTSHAAFLQQLGRVLCCQSLSSIPHFEIEKLRSEDDFIVQILNEDQWQNGFRAMAGLLLKNTLVTNYRMVLEDGVKYELRGVLLRGIIDGNASVRNASSSCISSLINLNASSIGEGWWDEVIPFLKWCLDVSTNANAEDGALSTTRKVIEDSPNNFNIDLIGGMVPSLINILKEGGSCEKLEGALKCLNGLIGPMPSTLVVNMNTYWSN